MVKKSMNPTLIVVVVVLIVLIGVILYTSTQENYKPPNRRRDNWFAQCRQPRNPSKPRPGNRYLCLPRKNVVV